MKQRTIITNRKHVNILLIAVMILMVASLTGCSKKPASAVEESKPSTESSTVAVEVKPSEEAEAASEPAAEPSAAPEPVVYEGIDMESDLPCEEWLKTFVGVVDEPVVIIYNDNTGKKEIVQEGNIVNVESDVDKVAIYLPEEGMKTQDCKFPVKEGYAYEFYEIWITDVAYLKGYSECPARVNVVGGAEDWTVNFYILVE